MSTSKFSYEIRCQLYKNKKNLNGIIVTASAVLLAIILIVCLYFIVGPMKKTYEAQLNTIFEYKEKSSQINDLKILSKKMSDAVISMDNIYNAVSEIVPDRKNIPYVTSLISLAAEKNDVTISSMSRAIEKDKTVGDFNFKIVRYNISLLSTYGNIINFLATLETSKSIFSIENIAISPPSEEQLAKISDPTLVKTNLVIDIYMKE